MSRVRWSVAIGLALTLAGRAGAGTPTPEPSPISATTGSYDLGLLLGNQLLNNGLQGTLERDDFLRGLNEALQGKPLSASQRDTAQQFARAARKSLGEHNAQAAHDFLAKNGKLPAVKTTASGLQYRVLEQGAAQAPSPGPTDQVNLRYTASLADGTVVDRSAAHAQPPVFRVNSVIPAWREALLAMKPGAKWQLFVGPELGYGMDAPPPLPPGALIIYELELLQVDSTPKLAPQLPRAH
jgi:FKBP-type peptidyl-prolyl cis-trans isomerase